MSRSDSCFHFLRENGYEYPGRHLESISYDFWSKDFGEYRISILRTEPTQFIQGLTTIFVSLNNEQSVQQSVPTPRLTLSTRSFDNWPEMERMVKDEIVPNMKKWLVAVQGS